MQNGKNRQEEIKNLLSVKEKMTISALAEYFKVTGATIRTDVRDMESRQEVMRSNGVVSLMRPYVVNLDVKEKIFINAQQKDMIGAAAAEMIGDMDSVILTSGTTIEAMTRHIVPKGHLNVVTPSVSVALNLARVRDVDIYMLGGKIQTTSLSVRDSYSLQGLENVSSSKLFLSCDGFDLSTGVITATLEEAVLTRALMKVAAQTILLADSSKLGKTGFGFICPLKDVDILIIDSGIPVKIKERIEALGVHVGIA